MPEINSDLHQFNGKMRYKILLFDLDDTLLDFGANEIDSLTKLFQQHGYPFSDELFRVYNAVNRQLWAEYENGTIALADVLNTRFSETMARLGKAVDGKEWEDQYRELLGNGCQLIEGALEVCRSLSASHRLILEYLAEDFLASNRFLIIRRVYAAMPIHRPVPYERCRL